MFKPTSSPFGGRTRTRVLVVISLLGSTYPREMARLLETNLNSIRKALATLELDGLVAGRPVGRTRVYEFNPAYFARDQLRAFVGRLAEADGALRDRTAQLRRRPRRMGKPL